jgi:hypothetical protein
MTETMIPPRDVVCRPRVVRAGYPDHHQPDPPTVESESSVELEWQFADCRHCGQSIARFRRLNGGRWFDRWGALSDFADLIDRP